MTTTPPPHSGLRFRVVLRPGFWLGPGKADLLQAICGRNGECPLPVIAARSPGDCFDVAQEAWPISTKFMVPVMLLTNYAEFQEAAVKLGAVRGFGKSDYAKPETVEKLRPFLADK